MNLSKRLTAVASLITEGNSIADIGTDHGYIPIYMAQNGLTNKAFAMDVNEGPLERARDNISRYCVEDTVTTRLSDGLAGLNEGEAETIVIAGMGGLLTIRIISSHMSVAKSARELILSPHSDVNLVRRFLADNNFCICDEKIVLEDEKFYFVLKVTVGDMKIASEEEAVFGKILLDRKDNTLLMYLHKEESKRLQILDKMCKSGSQNEARIAELNRELDVIREAIKKYESDRNS